MPYSPDHKLKSKERILQSATELFCRYGFDKVSIGEVMKLARMTHGAFYAHFESKEALFKAALADTFRRCKASRLAKAPFSMGHLTQLVDNYLNLRNLADHGEPGPDTILLTEIGSDRPEIKSLYEQAYLNLVKLLETRITALGRLNKLPFADDSAFIAARARAILAALVGALAIARSIESEHEKRSILLAAQDQIVAMLYGSGLPVHKQSVS